MTFTDVINEITSIIGFQKKKETVAYYIKITMMVLALLLLGAVSYYIFRLYRISNEQAAQKLLGEYSVEFQKALQTNKPQEWSDVASLFKLGHEQYSNTNIGTYFLGFQAEALVKQGKRVQAVEILNTMINQLKKQPQVALLFKLKRSLIKLDIQDEKMVEEGLQELADLAQDTTNTYRDTAQFYLGNYYWTHNELTKAKSIWEEFIAESQTSKPPLSPWISVVEQKLAQIS